MPLKTSKLPLRLLLGTLLVAGALAGTPVFANPGSGGDGGGGGGGGSDGGGGGGSSNSSVDVSGPTLADANALIRAKNWAGAIKVLKQIVAASPRNADALNLLGYSLRKSGDMKNALGFYQKALKINPKHMGAHEYLGELYVETGQLAKAKEELAILEDLCGNTTCEEYEDLEKAIKAAS